MTVFDYGPRARSAAETHPGLVRERNEDAWLTDDRLGVWGVADGMGGHGGGDVASAIAVRHLGLTRTNWDAPGALAADLVARVEDANHEIRTEAWQGGRRPPGTTLVCLVRFRSFGLVAWCGDSRAYRYGADSGGLVRLTTDHSVVQGMVDRGEIDAEAAEAHPDAHVLTRALGVVERPDLDFVQIDLNRGDRVLLCSDGLTRPVPEAAIAAEMARHRDPADTCRALVERTLAAGAPDNVTVVVIHFD